MRLKGTSWMKMIFCAWYSSNHLHQWAYWYWRSSAGHRDAWSAGLTLKSTSTLHSIDFWHARKNRSDYDITQLKCARHFLTIRLPRWRWPLTEATKSLGSGKKVLRNIFKPHLPKHIFNTTKRGLKCLIINGYVARWENIWKKSLTQFLVLQQNQSALGKIVSSGILRGELPTQNSVGQFLFIIGKSVRFRMDRKTWRSDWTRSKTTAFNQRPARITCRFSEVHSK